MNTPAHLLVGAALLGRNGSGRALAPVLAGSLLPDLPIFLFYAWQKLALATPERTIWGETYFEPGWQAFFDLFNSVPIAAAGLALAWIARREAPRLFFAAMLLHFALDLPLHYDDGHRHLFPLSSWRFESPVSYWDPARLGNVGAALELACVAAASLALARRTRRASLRVALAGLVALHTAVYAAFYVVGTVPTF